MKKYTDQEILPYKVTNVSAYPHMYQVVDTGKVEREVFTGEHVSYDPANNISISRRAKEYKRAIPEMFCNPDAARAAAYKLLHKKKEVQPKKKEVSAKAVEVRPKQEI